MIPVSQSGAAVVKLAVGNGYTTTVAAPVWFWLHTVLLASVTLIRLYVNVPAVVVGTATATELPVVVVTVWLAPPLML